MNKLELQKTANEIRKGIVTAVHSAKAGHPGGSLSAADVFTYLYFEEMNIDPKDPKKADRDRFVLSKGHTAPGLYSALAHKGFFPVEDLKTLRHIGSYLQGHPDMKHIPGVDMSSGSLGQGISAAVGMALSAKLSGDSYRVYTLLGDGEIQEGQVWEAAMFAGHRNLDNLVGSLGILELLFSDFLLCLLDIELGEQFQEPALDKGEAQFLLFLLSLHLCELGSGSICQLVLPDSQIVFHQIHSQSGIGTLFGLLIGSDNLKGVGGLTCHAGQQFLFQIGTGNTGFLEVDVSADNLLGDVVVGESELLGGSSDNSQVVHSSVHNVFPSGS